MPESFLLKSNHAFPWWHLIPLAAIGLLLLLMIYYLRRSSRSSKRSAALQERCQENPPLAMVSPLSGKLIPLSQVKDPTFSSGVMGKGCAILPCEGKVYAPCDGVISNIADSRHAISIDSKEGIALLIHIGKNTVELKGKHFEPCCKVGDQVKTGDLLLSFDMDAIQKDGYDLTTPILVINAHRYEDLALTAKQKIAAGDRLFTLTLKGKSVLPAAPGTTDPTPQG